MSLNWVNRPIVWSLLAIGTLCAAPAIAQAQEKSPEASTIIQPSIPDKVTQVTGPYKFWSETGLLDDAKIILNIDPSEWRIDRRSRNFEALYLDLLQQQSNVLPVVRTQDGPNPFETSLQELSK
jgi:hypothetical protein